MALKPKSYGCTGIDKPKKKIYILCVKEHTDKEITGWDELSFYRLSLRLILLYTTLCQTVYFISGKVIMSLTKCFDDLTVI